MLKPGKLTEFCYYCNSVSCFSVIIIIIIIIIIIVLLFKIDVSEQIASPVLQKLPYLKPSSHKPHNNLRRSLCHYVCSVNSNITRSLRSSSRNLFVIPRSKLKSYGDRAFSVSAPKLWIDIPEIIKCSADLNAFKRYLKTYLFKRYFNE